MEYAAGRGDSKVIDTPGPGSYNYDGSKGGRPVSAYSQWRTPPAYSMGTMARSDSPRKGEGPGPADYGARMCGHEIVAMLMYVLHLAPISSQRTALGNKRFRIVLLLPTTGSVQEVEKELLRELGVQDLCTQYQSLSGNKLCQAGRRARIVSSERVLGTNSEKM